MAAIMQEWQAILATVKKISEKTGVGLPGDLARMEGDVWARQAGRLRALSGWLRAVEADLPKKQAKADEPEQPAEASAEKPEGPATETLVPAPKPPHKKKAA